MNLTTENAIPEYVQSLPKKVQDVVLNNVWQDRTEEIAKKYSLNTQQTDSLIDLTLYILIGLDTPDVFLSNLTNELGISQLLAEQIINDLDTRVFQYALSIVEGADKNMGALPEPRPDITPMIEEEEKLTVRPVPTTPTQSSPTSPFATNNGLQTPRYTGETETPPDSKPVSTTENTPKIPKPVYIPPYKPLETKPADDRPHFTIRSRVPESTPEDAGGNMNSGMKSGSLGSHILYTSEGNGAQIEKKVELPKVDPFVAKRAEIAMSESALNATPKPSPFDIPKTEIAEKENFGILGQTPPVPPSPQTEQKRPSGYVDPYREQI